MPDPPPPPVAPPAPPRRGHWLLGGLRARLLAAEELVRHPSRIPVTLRGSAVALWASRGGGCYGLGYAVTFLWAEARALVEELFGDEPLGDTLLEQVLQLLFRFSEQSLLNLIEALIWPVLVLEAFGGWGILALVAGFALFDPVLRPLVERALPELRIHREAREQAQTEQAAAKAARKAARSARWQARKQQVLGRRPNKEPADDDVQPQ